MPFRFGGTTGNAYGNAERQYCRVMNFLNADSTVTLLIALLPVLVLLALRYGARRRAALLRALVGETMTVPLTASLHTSKRRFKKSLGVAALVLCALAAMRPWWGNRLIPRSERSRDILVLLDCSRSMLAGDVAPSRLEHAKWWLRELVADCPGDRFGLVAFSGDAFLECPLTRDRNTLFQFLEDMDTDTIPVGGTNLERALQTAYEAFRGAEGRHQAVLLISDGGELQGNARSQLDRFSEKELPVFVVGLGDPARGATIQLEDNTYLRNQEGELVSTRLNESGLRELSSHTGGVYVRSTTVSPNLAPVRQRIRRLVPQTGKETQTSRPVERYQFPLAAAVFLLIIRLSLSERRRRHATTVASLFILGTLTASATGTPGSPVARSGLSNETTPRGGRPQHSVIQDNASAATLDRDARKRAAKQIAGIREQLQDTTGREKARLWYNLGWYQQRLGDLDAAREAYQKSLEAAPEAPTLRARTHQNLGVVQHKEGLEQSGTQPDAAMKALEKAEMHYREALRVMPGDPDVARNQELLIRKRQEIEKLQKMRRQLEDLRKQTRRKTRKARQEQQKTNQDGSPNSRRRQQRKAASQTKDAQQLAQRLAEQARQSKDSQAAKQADKARTALDRAHQAQDQALRDEENSSRHGRQAEEHLAEAMKALKEDNAGNEQPEHNAENEDADSERSPEMAQNRKPGRGQDSDDPVRKPNAPPTPDEERTAAGDTGKPGEIDEVQARAILQQMQREEKDLRRAIKQQRMKERRLKPVKRDW